MMNRAVPSSSSSSSFTHAFLYDVFLSFRGQDTRTGFTGNLYNSLHQKGFRTFIDDEGLRRGEEITSALLEAIHQSRIAIIVFSKSFAFSTFCLDELAKILERLDEEGRSVLPVFYGVDPSEVRHQMGSYGEALSKHQRRFKNDQDKVQKWKLALQKAADISGWHFKQGHEYEYKFIGKVVKEVSIRLKRTFLHIANYPVGLKSQVPEINTLLGVGSDDKVNMVGIYGIGGIRKTTVARAVFNSMADQFEGLCFLADVREKSKHSLVQLQETLLSDLVMEKDIKLEDGYQGIQLLKDRLKNKKVLVIVDDVDKIEQLEALAGGWDWFGIGSKIIITTRDKHLFGTQGIETIYEVKELNHKKSLRLFCWYAFKSNKVDPSYMDISNCIVDYAKGLPLDLEIIGSNLFGKTMNEWESALDTYRRNPITVKMHDCPINTEDLPINTDMFQNTEELNVENCPQLPKLLGKALMVNWTDWRPKLNRLVLKNCDISDRDLELIFSSFLQMKWLVLSNNIFVTIPECIEDLENLLFLHVDNCKQLRHISVLPPSLQYIDARNCIALTPDSSGVLLSQAVQEVENIDILVLRKKIPNWFDHCGKGGYVDFWVRRKFPGIAVFMLLGGKAELADTSLTCEYRLLINSLQVFQDERTLPVDHVWLFDLRIHFTAQKWYSLKEHLRAGWNHVEISCCVKNNQPQIGSVKCCGIHLYKDRMNMNDVSFINPDLRGSDMACNEMNNRDDTDIYDDTNLGSSRTRDEEEEEEEEQRLTDNGIPESCEAVVKDKGKRILCSKEEHQSWDSMRMESVRGESSKRGAKSSKIQLGPSTEAEPLVTTIHYEEPMFQGTGNLRENGNLTQEPASPASTSIYRGEPVNGSSNVKVSEYIGLTNSKHNLKNQAESNSEAETSHTQIAEIRANQRLEAREMDYQISMDAFYASLAAEAVALSYPQYTQTNTESINTEPSEETKKALGILRDLLGKRFSLLLEPKRSKLMEDILEYLMSLAPEDGISLKVKSAILEISRGFTQCGLDYNDASLKLESASAEISRVDELKEELEANVREFREADELENVIWSKLDYLEERKKQLEEEIKAIKAEIEDFSSAREDAAKRKSQVFENGRMLKAERDDLRNRVPRLRAEQERAKVIQAYIEDEWSKLGQQFLESSTFEN